MARWRLEFGRAARRDSTDCILFGRGFADCSRLHGSHVSASRASWVTQGTASENSTPRAGAASRKRGQEHFVRSALRPFRPYLLPPFSAADPTQLIAPPCGHRFQPDRVSGSTRHVASRRAYRRGSRPAGGGRRLFSRPRHFIRRSSWPGRPRYQCREPGASGFSCRRSSGIPRQLGDFDGGAIRSRYLECGGAEGV